MVTHEPEHDRTMQARVQPTSDAALVEYLLSTEQPEMEFETARCRPLLTQDFMAFLKQEVGAFLFLIKEASAVCQIFLASTQSVGVGLRDHFGSCSASFLAQTSACLSLTSVIMYPGSC